jgi:hypothetical protein
VWRISYAGVHPRPWLIEARVPRSGNELVTALQLVDEPDRFHGCHRCDLIVVDSGFVDVRFINEIRARHKHVLVRIEQEHMLIIRKPVLEAVHRRSS